MEKKIDYASAGVDVERGYEAVQKMKSHVKKTHTDNVLSSLGGFSGMFALPTGYTEPILVAGTDGVGTKLRIAFDADNHRTIGIDCVAMCANDVACSGAKPLFFLDYIGTGYLEPTQIEQIVEGVVEGCLQAGCAIIGGETAEMPGFYPKNEYDLAGFCVGVVEKEAIIDGHTISENDCIIGVSSSGLHSNGFSLVQKLCFDVAHVQLNDFSYVLQKTYLEELLTPTKIYVSLIQRLIALYSIKGIAHITGGGWIENIPRVLPDDMRAVVDKSKMPVPPIFPLLQSWGNLDENDMYNTFNMGMGLAIVVDEKDVDSVLNEINKTDDAYCIGKIQKRQQGDERIEFM